MLILVDIDNELIKIELETAFRAAVTAPYSFVVDQWPVTRANLCRTRGRNYPSVNWINSLFLSSKQPN